MGNFLGVKAWESDEGVGSSEPGTVCDGVAAEAEMVVLLERVCFCGGGVDEIDGTMVRSGSSSSNRGMYRPPPTVSLLEKRLNNSELFVRFGVRLELVTMEATDPLRKGCLRSSFSSGISSDSLDVELFAAGGRREGDRRPIGLGGMAEKVVNPLMEGLRVCVGRSEKVGWKSCWPVRVGDPRGGVGIEPVPIPVKRGGVEDSAVAGGGENVE